MEKELRLAELLCGEGAAAFGVARAMPVEEREWRRFEEWLSKGHHAGMEYMERYSEIRRDPRLLLEGARSVVSVAFNYRQPNPCSEVATYALGEDYHKAIRRRLKKVVRDLRDEFGGQWRICIDSAPVLERYWAERCAVGMRSPVHGNIVVPGVGSMVFLSEIITTLQFEETPRLKNIPEMGTGPSVCPTGALLPGGTVDANRCINYLTIECRHPLSDAQKKLVGNSFFGCDRCQLACEENHGEYPDLLPEFRPLPGIEEFVRGENEMFPICKSAMKRKNPRPDLIDRREH